MENFLLTKKPFDVVRISTALYVRVEQGEFTGILEEEVWNFTKVLERVLVQIPLDDIERKKKLKSFGTGSNLKDQVKINYFIVVQYVDMIICNF